MYNDNGHESRGPDDDNDNEDDHDDNRYNGNDNGHDENDDQYDDNSNEYDAGGEPDIDYWYRRGGFVKLPLSFQFPLANCGRCALEHQLQLQVSVVRRSDNKTAQVFNTNSQMCEMRWSEGRFEGRFDPARIYWKQTVEGVVEGLDLTVCMGQSSTVSYKDVQVKSIEESLTPGDLRDLESITFHCFWIGFQLALKTPDNESMPVLRFSPGHNRISHFFALTNLSWH